VNLILVHFTRRKAIRATIAIYGPDPASYAIKSYSQVLQSRGQNNAGCAPTRP